MKRTVFTLLALFICLSLSAQSGVPKGKNVIKILPADALAYSIHGVYERDLTQKMILSLGLRYMFPNNQYGIEPNRTVRSVTATVQLKFSRPIEEANQIRFYYAPFIRLFRFQTEQDYTLIGYGGTPASGSRGPYPAFWDYKGVGPGVIGGFEAFLGTNVFVDGYLGCGAAYTNIDIKVTSEGYLDRARIIRKDLQENREQYPIENGTYREEGTTVYADYHAVLPLLRVGLALGWRF